MVKKIKNQLLFFIMLGLFCGLSSGCIKDPKNSTDTSSISSINSTSINSTTNSNSSVNSSGGGTIIPEDDVSFESIATKNRNAYSLAGEGWKFYNAPLTNGEKAITYNVLWDDVSIPHTWNTEDLYGGTQAFKRCESWYHKQVTVTNEMLTDKIQYLEFLGVNMQAKVYINEQLVGAHKGGYTGFRFNVSEFLHAGDNLLAVWVSNVKVEDIAPIGADFNFYGGIYRQVNLITVDKTHVDLMDYGSSGLKLTQSEVSNTSAKLNITTNLVNENDQYSKVKVKTTMRVPDSFEINPKITRTDFNIANLTTGEVIFTNEEEVTVPGNGEYLYGLNKTITNPILWNGRENPFRYQVIVEIYKNDKKIDEVSSYVGFRYFNVTKAGGFFLNGNPYPLRGASRHQDWKGMGNAISKENHDIDFAYMYEIGMNSIRLAHYPHSNYFVELCDKYGLVTWAEIPFVNDIGNDSNFATVTKNQLVELIRQQYNRPSICVWGLQNEVKETYGSQMVNLIKDLNDLAHSEDPSRLTAQATNHANAKNWSSDLLAWNTYPGWYSSSTMTGNMDDYANPANYSMPVGISEYGYGSNINQHEEYPVRSQSNGGVWAEGSFHPVEYQNQQHELAVKEVTNPARNNVWCAYIWNMFDFASAPRQEGSTRGMNDKGLISYDRTIKKDSFYLYKANWNSVDKFIHLTSKDYTARKAASTYVKAYSNCQSVALYVNDNLVSVKENNGYGIFKWDDIFLPDGANTSIKVKVMDEGLTSLEDSATWTRSKSSSLAIFSNTLAIDTTNKVIYYKNGMLVADIPTAVKSYYNCKIEVLNTSNAVITTGLVDATMKVRITSENGSANTTYTLQKALLSTNKPVTVSTEQGDNQGQNVVDGSTTTRWAATSEAYPQWLVIDLGGTFTLQELEVRWYGSSRSYKYKISVSTNNSTWTNLIDFSNNTSTAMTFTHALNNAKARYIRFDVTGCSANTAFASIYYVNVIGWGINSTLYQISEVAKTITITQSASTISKEDFLKNLMFEGDCEILFDTEGTTLKDGDKVTFKDTKGTNNVYTIKIKS